MEGINKSKSNNHKLFSYFIDILVLALAYKYEGVMVSGNEIQELNF